MVIGNDGFQTRFLARPAETSGVSKLQADDKVRALTEAFAVSLDHLAAQLGQSGGGSLVQKQLVRVGPCLGKHRHGFASPNQLGAALLRIASSAGGSGPKVRRPAGRPSLPWAARQSGFRRGALPSARGL